VLVANDAAGDAWLPGVPRIGDLRPRRGPLAGIHAALAHLGTSIVAVAWDMPFVASGLLAELRRRGAGGAIAVVPENAEGRLEPTCAYYAAASRTLIERWLDDGQSGATAFLEQCAGVHRMRVADVRRFGDPAQLFFSINTPTALERAQLLSGHS